MAACPAGGGRARLPHLTDGGAENYANILHDVRIETFDDVDRVTFVFGPNRLAPPTGPVTYWQAPPFSVTPVDGDTRWRSVARRRTTR